MLHEIKYELINKDNLNSIENTMSISELQEGYEALLEASRESIKINVLINMLDPNVSTYIYGYESNDDSIFKRIWKKIVEAIKKMWNAMIKFVKKVFGLESRRRIPKEIEGIRTIITNKRIIDEVNQLAILRYIAHKPDVLDKVLETKPKFTNTVVYNYIKDLIEYLNKVVGSCHSYLEDIYLDDNINLVSGISIPIEKFDKIVLNANTAIMSYMDIFTNTTNRIVVKIGKKEMIEGEAIVHSEKYKDRYEIKEIDVLPDKSNLNVNEIIFTKFNVVDFNMKSLNEKTYRDMSKRIDDILKVLDNYIEAVDNYNSDKYPLSSEDKEKMKNVIISFVKFINKFNTGIMDVTRLAAYMLSLMGRIENEVREFIEKVKKENEERLKEIEKKLAEQEES